ncbi:Ig-like domain-containing protein [Mycolicibacterium sp. XJ1819]
MRYAKYVGRVGALAVALGVGSVISPMPGVAWAQPTGSNSTDSAESTSSESSTAPDSATVNAGTDGSGVDASTDDATIVDTPATDGTDEGVVVPGSDAVDPPGDDDGGLQPEPDVEPVAEPPGQPYQPQTFPGGSHRDDVPSDDAAVSAIPTGQVNSVAQHDLAVADSKVVTLSTTEATVLPPMSQPTGGDAEPQVLEPVHVPNAAPEPAQTVRVDLVTRMLAAVFAPFIGSGPAAPADSPLLWALLAWARRQSGSSDEVTPALVTTSQLTTAAAPMAMSVTAAADGNQPPTQIAGPTLQDAVPATGTIVGQLNLIDPEGKTLRYELTGAPTSGMVVVDSRTGAFTYTPDAVARVAAGLTPGADTDSFTVSVRDGSRRADAVPVVVTVPVSPVVVANQPPVSLGDNSIPVAVTVSGSRVYVANSAAGTVSVIETATGTAEVVDAIDLGTASSPVAVTASPDGTRVYVVDAGSLSVIATATNTVVGTPVAVGHTPAGIAVAPNGKTVFVANSDGTVSKVTVSNMRVRNVTGLPQGTPGAITVSPDGRKIYVANADGSISMFTSSGSRAKTVATGIGDPAGLAVSPDNKTLYFADREGNVVVIETRRHTVVDTFAVGGTPTDVAVSGNGRVLIVVDANSVTLVDAANGAVLTGVATDAGGKDGSARIAFSADGTHLYLTDPADDTLRVLTVLPRATNTAPSVAGPPTAGAADPGNGALLGSLLVSDADADTLTYTVIGAPDKGTVTIDPAGGGTYTYTPTARARHIAAAVDAAAEDKTDAFTVLVTDGYGTSVTVPVTVTIEPANTAPTTKSTVRRPSSTGVVKGTVTARDADRDKLTYEGSTTTAKGTVVVDSRGRFTYTPTAEARHAAAADGATATDQTDSFTITVDDGHGGTVAVPITVTIKSVNTRPKARATVGTPDASSGIVTGTVSATDNDADTLVYTASPTTKGDVVIDSDGTFTYTPRLAAQLAAGANGARTSDTTEKFTITVDDGHGGTTTVRVTATIAAVTPSPAITGTVGVGSGPLDVAVSPDGRYVYTAGWGSSYSTHDGGVTVLDTATDTVVSTVDIDGTVYGVVAAPDGKVYAVSTNDADGAGTVSIIDTATRTVTGSIGLTAGNYPTSVAVTQDGKTLVVASHDGTVTVIDTATRTVTRTLNVGGYANQIAITPNGREVWVAHDDAYPQVSVITLSNGRVKDVVIGDYPSAPGVVASPDGKWVYVASDGVAVIKVGTRPTVTTIEGVYGEDLAISPDGRYLYVAQADGALKVVDTTTKTVVKTVTVGDRADAVAVSADGARIYVTNRLDGTVTVLAAYATNAAPTVSAAVGEPDPDTGAVRGSITATDPDGDAVTVTAGTWWAARGSVTVDPDGTFTYTPTDDARHRAAAVDGPTADKTDAFEVTVSDARGQVATVSVTVPIGPANNAPGAFVPDWELTTDPSTGKVTGRIYGSDLDGDTLAYGGSAPSGKGTLVVGPDGRFTYTPTEAARHAASAVGASTETKTDTVTLTVDDGHGGLTETQVTITISPANAEPIYTGWTGTTDPVTGVVTGQLHGFDADGDPLSFDTYYSWGPGGPIHNSDGTLVLNSDGSFTYTPSASARFAAAATDATAADKNATWSIVVSDGHGVEPGANQTLSVAISPAVLDHQVAASHVLDGFDFIREIVTGPDGRIYVGQVRWNDYSDWRSYQHGPADSASIVVIDPDNGFQTYSIALTHLSDFSDMAVTPNGRIYLVDKGTVVEVNPDTRVEAVVSGAAAGPEYNRIVAGTDNQIYLFGGSGSAITQVKRINPAEHYDVTYDSMLQNIRDLAVDADGRMYLGSADQIEIIDPDATATVIDLDDDYPTLDPLISLHSTPEGRVFARFLSENDGFYQSNSLNEIHADGTVSGAVWSPSTYRGYSAAVLGVDGLFYAWNSQDDHMATVDPTRPAMSLSTLGGQWAYASAVDADGRIYAHDWTGYRVAGEYRVRSTVTVISPTTAGAPAADPVHVYKVADSVSVHYERLREVTNNTHGVYVEKIVDMDGQERLIAYIGGTTADFVGPNQPWIENIPAAIGFPDPKILEVLDRAVADNPDAPLLIFGYSQGGIDAQNIAVSGRYENLTTVVTFGTAVIANPAGSLPSGRPNLPEDVHVVHIVDQLDPVTAHASFDIPLQNAVDAGQVMFGRGGVEPDSNVPLFGYVNVHTDMQTYRNLGAMFENPDDERFAEVKQDLKKFQGKVVDDVWQ